MLVGKSVGAGELDDAYERAKRLVPLCAGIIVVVIGLLLAVHKPLLTAMSLSGESYRLGLGLLCIYGVMGAIRMCNWTMNDTYRSAGDATMGTVLEITFMYLMVLPCVTVSGLVLHAPFLVIFACCFVDEPVRFFLMQRHMYSGRWVKPVTPAGKAALPAFRDKHDRKKRAAAGAD